MEDKYGTFGVLNGSLCCEGSRVDDAGDDLGGDSQLGYSCTGGYRIGCTVMTRTWKGASSSRSVSFRRFIAALLVL